MNRSGKMDRVRVLRVIEYVGDREWVENTLSRSIQGTKVVDSKYGKANEIRTAIVGNFPEILIDNEGDKL